MRDSSTFWSKVDQGSPAQCWPWLAGRTPEGYGRVLWFQKQVYAHRLSYELTRGVIPPGLVIDHLCRNTTCVNPDHLEAVTQRENTLRGNGIGGVNAAKTHCPKGHEYTPENTYMGRYGGRSCRACKRAYHQSRKQAAAR